MTISSLIICCLLAGLPSISLRGPLFILRMKIFPTCIASCFLCTSFFSVEKWSYFASLWDFLWIYGHLNSMSQIRICEIFSDTGSPPLWKFTPPFCGSTEEVASLLKVRPTGLFTENWTRCLIRVERSYAFSKNLFRHP